MPYDAISNIFHTLVSISLMCDTNLKISRKEKSNSRLKIALENSRRKANRNTHVERAREPIICTVVNEKKAKFVYMNFKTKNNGIEN